jgi:hypothetical protein
VALVSTRRRIDWAAARTVFVSDPTRSFAKVARRFGVSDVAVRNHAKREGWEDAARKFDRDVEDRALRAAVKTRDRHVLDATRARDLAFDLAIEGMVAKTLDVKLADLPAIGKYVELLTGEATDRVELGEVREFVSVLFVRVLPLIEPARRGELVALLHELEGELPGARGAIEA